MAYQQVTIRPLTSPVTNQGWTLFGTPAGGVNELADQLDTTGRQSTTAGATLLRTLQAPIVANDTIAPGAKVRRWRIVARIRRNGSTGTVVIGASSPGTGTPEIGTEPGGPSWVNFTLPWQTAAGVYQDPTFASWLVQVRLLQFSGSNAGQISDAKIELEVDRPPAVLSLSNPGTVTVPQPTFTWTYLEVDGDPQRGSYAIVVAGHGHGDEPPAQNWVAWEFATGPSTSFTPTSLPNGTYTLWVRVQQDASNVDFRLVSPWVKREFTVNVPATPMPTMTATPAGGHIDLDIGQGGTPAAEYVDVERGITQIGGGQVTVEEDFVRIADEVPISSTVALRDRTVAFDRTIVYRVRGIRYEGGLRYVSDWRPVLAEATTDTWWVTSPSNPTLDAALSVRDLQTRRPRPHGIFDPLEGGTVVITGPVRARRSRITVEVWSIDDLVRFERIYEANEPLLLRDPEGPRRWVQILDWIDTVAEGRMWVATWETVQISTPPAVEAQVL